MNAMVNEKLCTGCGICEIICPEVFQMKDRPSASPIASVRDNVVPDDAVNFCNDAADCCPQTAIQIEENFEGDPRRAGRMLVMGRVPKRLGHCRV